MPNGNGYYILGTTMENSTNVWLIKTDLFGNIIWQEKFGGTKADESKRILQSVNGNYYIVATTYSVDGDVTYDPYPDALNFWIIMIDSEGNKIWDKVVGGNCREYVMDGIATSDGGVVAMGYSCSTDGDITNNYGGFDIWAFKLDSAGAKVWDFTLGSSGLEMGFGVAATSDGGFLLCGTGMVNADGNMECTPHSGDYEGLLVKLDSNGVMQWQRCYGGSDSDLIRTAIEVNDGYLIAGCTSSNDGDMEDAGYHEGYNQNGNKTTDVWLAKIDFEGNIIWSKCFGGGSWEATARIFKTENDNYFVFAGTSSFDGDVSGNHSLSVYYDEIWVLKISSSGTLLWQQCIGGEASERISSGVIQKSDSTWVVAASAQGTSTGDITCGPPQGETDYYIWAFELADTKLYASTQHPETIHVTVKPNPASDWVAFDYILPEVNATLTIQDALGRKIETFVLTGKKGQKLWSTKGFPEGIYFCSLRAGGYIKTEKLLIRK